MAITRQVVISGANAIIHTPAWAGTGAGLRGVLCQHGHGGNAYQIQQGLAFAGHPEQLADKGYVVAGIDTGDQWLSAAAMTAMTNLYNYLIGTIGIAGPKVGLMGWSMGGGHCLRWTLENVTKVAVGFIFNPITDLDWAHSQAGWTAEMDTIYANNYAANGSPRSPRNNNNIPTFRGGPRIRIAHATDDTVIPYSVTTDFIANVNDPAVTLRTPDMTGGHQGGLINTPPAESAEWMRTQWAS